MAVQSSTWDSSMDSFLGSKFNLNPNYLRPPIQLLSFLGLFSFNLLSSCSASSLFKGL